MLIKKTTLSLLVIILTSFCINVEAQESDKLFPLHPNTISLHGHLEHDITNTIENWSITKVPYEEFASFFSKGRPKFASGEMWGKAVRAASMFYRYNNDDRLKEILDRTVNDLLEMELPNGSISCSSIEEQPDAKGGDLWERKYVLLGLERYYTLVNQDEKVLNSMIRQVDALIAQIGPAPKTPITDTGWSPNRIESSTILEPIMRVYNLTKEKRFLDFAKYIIDEGGSKGYNLVEQALQNMAPHKMAGGEYPKAYDMLSFFEGLAEYYRVTGDERIKKAIINLYTNVAEKEITIVGNGGNDLYHNTGECWGDTAYEQTNPNIERMMETCVGVTWLKFSSQVARLTGDAAIIDMMERYIYNGLTGSLKPTGEAFSYSNLLNGTKDNPLGWGVYYYNKGRITCCELNGPMGLAYIPYIAAMQSEKGPVINLYNSADLHFESPKGQPIELKMESEYPKHGTIAISVNPDKKETFEISLRIPSWSVNTKLKVNGISQDVNEGGYKTIKRDWKSGDTIELELDMRTRLINSPKKDGYVALQRGPLVLARNENMDPSFKESVTVISDNGFVETILEDATIPFVTVALKVPTTDGYIKMIDYSSSDNWNGRETRTWLRVKE